MKEQEFSRIINAHYEEGFSFNPVSVPIYQTSNFLFDSYQDMAQALAEEETSHLYTRGNNPTVEVLEAKLAALEGGERAKLFGSGVAAIAAASLSFLQSGDHVVCTRDCYVWANRLFSRYLPRFKVEATFVDGCSPDEWVAAIRPATKLFFLESPTTYTFKLQDLEAIGRIARQHDIKTIIDNSWATPYFQNPLAYGIDVVVYSCSKYISGHSDVVAGVVVCSQEDYSRIFNTEFLNLGAVPSPFDSWLLLRGLRTLPIRMKQHYANALTVIEYLDQHPLVEEVWYPLHPQHPQVRLAQKYLRGGSGVLSFKLKPTSLEAVISFTNRCSVFKRAVSWGGYESLVLPIAATGVKDPDKQRTIRLHVGLEDPGLLIDDLEKAFKGLS